MYFNILSTIILSVFTPYMDGIGDHQYLVEFNQSTTCQIFAFIRYWRKNDHNGTALQLFMDFKSVYDSIRSKYCTYNILSEFGVPMKLLRPTEMWFNKAYNKAYIRKNYFLLRIV
jgi:hypothetical protein